jgi:hypothetical protein
MRFSEEIKLMKKSKMLIFYQKADAEKAHTFFEEENSFMDLQSSSPSHS